MIQLFLALALASTDQSDYQYVISVKQTMDGVPCSMDNLPVKEKAGELCAVHKPVKRVYGDYNICTYLVSCKEVDL